MKTNKDIFLEVSQLYKSSEKAWKIYGEIMSRLDNKSENILIISPTTSIARDKMEEYARIFLSYKINSNKMIIDTDDYKMYFKSITDVSKLNGLSFRKVIFLD